MSSHNFNKKITEGSWEVAVDEEAKYGYYEHQLSGSGGGLWFGKQEDTGELELVDFDGLGVLPANVKRGLILMDINVGEDF